MHWLTDAVVGSAKETALISCINVPVAFVAVFLLRTGFFDAEGLILLLEATALMLIGGAIDFGSSATGRKLTILVERKDRDWKKEDYQRHTRRAAVYTLTGLFLFAQALVLVVVTFR